MRQWLGSQFWQYCSEARRSYLVGMLPCFPKPIYTREYSRWLFNLRGSLGATVYSVNLVLQKSIKSVEENHYRFFFLSSIPFIGTSPPSWVFLLESWGHHCIRQSHKRSTSSGCGRLTWRWSQRSSEQPMMNDHDDFILDFLGKVAEFLGWVNAQKR